MSGWGSVREVAVSGLEDPMLCIRIVEANIDFQPIRMEEVEDNVGAPNEEDAESQNAVDAPVQKEEVHLVDELSEEVLPSSEPEDRQRRGTRQTRNNESEDEGGIDLPRLKKEEQWSYPVILKMIGAQGVHHGSLMEGGLMKVRRIRG